MTGDDDIEGLFKSLPRYEPSLQRRFSFLSPTIQRSIVQYPSGAERYFDVSVDEHFTRAIGNSITIIHAKDKDDTRYKPDDYVKVLCREGDVIRSLVIEIVPTSPRIGDIPEVLDDTDPQLTLRAHCDYVDAIPSLATLSYDMLYSSTSLEGFDVEIIPHSITDEQTPIIDQLAQRFRFGGERALATLLSDGQGPHVIQQAKVARFYDVVSRYIRSHLADDITSAMKNEDRLLFIARFTDTVVAELFLQFKTINRFPDHEVDDEALSEAIELLFDTVESIESMTGDPHKIRAIKRDDGGFYIVTGDRSSPIEMEDVKNLPDNLSWDPQEMEPYVYDFGDGAIILFFQDGKLVCRLDRDDGKTVLIDAPVGVSQDTMRQIRHQAFQNDTSLWSSIIKSLMQVHGPQ